MSVAANKSLVYILAHNYMYTVCTLFFLSVIDYGFGPVGTFPSVTPIVILSLMTTTIL